jgi:hypothetical protein
MILHHDHVRLGAEIGENRVNAGLMLVPAVIYLLLISGVVSWSLPRGTP